MTTQKAVRTTILMCVVIAAAALAGTGILTMTGGRGRCTEYNFRQIKRGMTMSQVQSILGKPVDRRRGESRVYTTTDRSGGVLHVVVPFDTSGRVAYVAYVDAAAARTGITAWMSRREVERKLGTTKSSHYGYRMSWYCEGPWWSLFPWECFIHFDESGKVAGKMGWYD